MDALLKNLYARREVLKAARARAEKMLDGAPEGTLRIGKHNGKIQYYHVLRDGTNSGQYIRKDDSALIGELSHKNYAEKLIRRIDEELKCLNKYVQILANANPDRVYETLSEQRQRIVPPLLLSAEKYAELWEKQSFTTNTSFPEEKQYETKRGEMVRSKSELVFANLYADLGIPYRYECELKLRDGTVKYPDFTLLDTRNRRVVYHEHFGLMDHPGYRETCFKKLDLYRRNGIYVGKNLIMTFEGKGSELNLREIRQMMQAVFGLDHV